MAKFGFVLAVEGVQSDVETFVASLEKAARELFGAPVIHRDNTWYDRVTEVQETTLTLVAATGVKHPAYMAAMLKGMTDRAWEIGTARGGTAMGDGGLNVWHGHWVWDHKRYD